MNWRQRLQQLFRRATPDRNGWVRIEPRFIYILPTRQGFILALLIFGMLLGSINYGSNLGYLYTFMLTGVGLITMLHTWRNLLGLEIGGVTVKAVFAGQEARFLVAVRNPEARRRPALELSSQPGAGGRVDLPGGSQAQIELLIPSQQRGELPLGRLRIDTRAPFGLLRAWSYLDLGASCLVYPRPAGQGEPPQGPAYAGSHHGDRGVGADDFVGLRNYRPGDSPRHLDWKAMARERGTLTKQFGGDRAEQLWLDWDQLPPLDAETKLSLLCRFLLLAVERGQSYGLRLPGSEIPLGRGESHLHQCLTALARFPTHAAA